MSEADLRSRMPIDQIRSGNVVLVGFASAIEIQWLVDSMTDDQVLFVIEPSKESWASAAHAALNNNWTIGQRLLFYRDIASFIEEFSRSQDLLVPETIVAYDDGGNAVKTVADSLKTLTFKIQEEIRAKSRVAAQTVDSAVRTGRRRWSSLASQPSYETRLLELFLEVDFGAGSGKILGLEGSDLRQLTPLWVLDRIIEEEITDFVAVNRLRNDLTHLLPSNMRWTCLLDRPIPELFEPGRPRYESHGDRVVPLNPSTRDELLKIGIKDDILMMPKSIDQANQWDSRDIGLLVIADAPDTTVLEALESHPTLAPLIKNLIQMLESAPAFINRNDLDLIFSLCERRTKTPLTIPAQRDWLLTLIHEHIVSGQNRRKIVLDLIRHQPDLPIRILGSGWDNCEEVGDRIVPPDSEIGQLLASAKCVVLTESIPGRSPNILMTSAMAMGCAVLNAEPGASPNPLHLLPGQHYLSYASLMELEQTCIELFRDPELARNVAAAGTSAIRSFAPA